MNEYLFYGIIATVLFVVELFYFKIADHYNIIDRPNQRSSHSSITLRGGGIIFLFGMCIYAIVSSFSYALFLLGLSLIAGVSFIDDIKPISNKIRLIVQFIAVGLMMYQWNIISIENWWMIIVALIICVGIINAYNFMDGINGITGGYSFAILFPLIVLNNKLEFVDSTLLLIAIISVIVFCFFNFRKKAKCFAGDVGSVGIAFILLFCIGKLVLATNDITYLLLLAVYGVDSVLTICHRLLLHENLGEAHRKHVYQLLSNELKIPHVVVSGLYVILQLAISFGLIYLQKYNWIYSICVIVILCVFYILFMKKYYHLHREYIESIVQ